MTLEALLGDAYRAGMTAEEIEAALADKEFVPKTPEKGTESGAPSELALAKARLRGISLPETPKHEEPEENGAMERLAALERENRLMKLKAQLMKGGYDADTAEKLANASADGDMETFVSVNNSFLDKRTEDLQVSIKNELLHQSAGTGGCGGNEGLEDGESAGISLARELGSAAAQRDAKSNEVLNYYTGGKAQ